MSILNVNQIQPVGSGQTITVSATNIDTGSATVTAGTFSGGVTATSGNLTGITSVSTTNLTVNGNAYPTAGPLSNRNLIINGAMTVHQRGSNITATGYIADRWRFNAANLDQWAGDATWETDSPDGFSRSIKMNTTTAETSFEDGDELSFEIRIEAQDLQHLDWGTANAKSLTLSFWVKCNKTGTQSIHVRVHDAGDGYSTSYSINSVDTWEYKTIVIPGNTAGSIDNDTGIGIWIRWTAADGNIAVTEDAWDTSNSGPYAVSGAMAFGTTIGDYLQLAGVQLEVGETATPFEHRSYGEELALCQRYYYEYPKGNTYNIVANGFANTTSNALFHFQFPVPMKDAPVVATTGNWEVIDGTSHSVTAFSNITDATTLTGRVDATSSGLTVGRGCMLRNSNDATATFSFSAEL